ncbi:MAG: PQQ-dependent sugar dehydrogenase [Pseudomonadota bacterium]
MHCIRLLALLLFCWAVAVSPAAGRSVSQSVTVEGDNWLLRIPAGTRLEVLNASLDGPRLMHFLPNGDLVIGSRSGKVYRLVPPYSHAEVLVELSGYPHSIVWRNGELLIARTDGLYRAPYTPGQQTIERDAVKLLVALPGGGGHNSRTVAIGPDKRIYIALGISGNCPNEYLDNSYRFDDRRGGVFVVDESGKEPKLVPFASGLRNPVGFDWHPQTGGLYASNNGPDHLGYEQPPEYFSRLTAGSFHGMPWYQFDGKRINRDSCIRSDPPRRDVTAPVATFPARNAPMGVTFVPEGALGNRYTGNAIVALKGSWGTKPSGGMFGSKATRRHPKLVMVAFSNGKATGEIRDLVTGLQRPDGERLLRPVGVAFGPDGALYFTSDSHLEGLFRLQVIH